MTEAIEAPMGPVGDSEMSWPVVASDTAFEGSVISVRQDTLNDGQGGTFERDVVEHPGAVAVVALDDDDRVLVVSQYRHPARRRLVELPAGLLDKEGEIPLDAAKRELAEEGHVSADRWTQLLTLMTSPGMSNEVVTLYLAEGIAISDVPQGFVANHEESSMTRKWVPLDDLVEAVLAGRATNALLVAGVLGTVVTRRRASA
jgi:ADP-ribose pyrophosphatase